VTRRKSPSSFFCCPTVLLALMLSLVSVSGAQIKEGKRVLMLEDQISAPAIEAVSREFEAGLAAKSPDPLEFFRESLDTFLIPEGDYQAAVRKWYEKKYSQRKLDLIVAIGPASHDFLTKEHAQYFASGWTLTRWRPWMWRGNYCPLPSTLLSWREPDVRPVVHEIRENQASGISRRGLYLPHRS
jgi:hypothetical protein